MSEVLFNNPTPFEIDLQAAFAGCAKATAAQAAAFERFAKLGFPNRRLEGWKWSDFNGALRKLSSANDTEAHADIAQSKFAALNPLEFRIVNGRIELPQGELPDGLRYGVVDPVAAIPELESHAIATLNVAMTRKALGIEIGEDAPDRPILIRHINTQAGFAFTQTLMRVSVNARVRLIETYEGEGSGFYSHIFHMVVRDGAQFHRTVVHETGADQIVNAVCAAKVDADAAFNQTSLSTGSRLSRHETIAHLWAPGGSSEINSAALLCDDRHSDFTTYVVHKAPHCRTRQLHKGVARDRGRNVFQGKFEVEREAQKTDAKMTANALLLSDTAEANHKPELEIYADDVECAHGSTCGALDEDALFYLRQRGLNEPSAHALLVEAFLGEVLDGIDDERLGEIFRSKIADWLVYE